MKPQMIILLGVFFVTFNVIHSQDINLTGEWSLGIDPMGKGVENDWHESFSADPGGLVRGWDVVTVPHSYTLDSRYNITGKAWYRRSFSLPENISEKVCRIRFSSVFYKTRVWVNGNYIGAHEGGYTPFMYDITRVVKPGANQISVEVDNRWDENTIPGARFGERPHDQVYPWYEYGGITDEVKLLITDKIFITRQKIEPEIDLKKNIALLNIKTWINQYLDTPRKINIEGYIAFADSPSVPLVRFTPGVMDAAPYLENLSAVKVLLKGEQLKLWDFDHPDLYSVTTIIKSGPHSDTLRTRTGLRVIEVTPDNLLLNGQPVRLGGANRNMDFPGVGSLETQEAVETDMKLMREGGMIMSRLHHYPARERLLDWADENGLLIIEQVPVWQNTPVILADPFFQARFMFQAKEMVERDWNRPSVIGWSSGNEYSTWTPEGDAFTKIITDYYRSLDPTRLATVISDNRASRPENIIVPHNSFRHCDIICINYNIPSEVEKHLERVREKFPDKPIIMSEFTFELRPGSRTEKDREDLLMYYLNTIRAHPYVVGAAWWTINDYLSRFPGTDPDGTRKYGMLSLHRDKLDLYYSIQREFSPLIAEKGTSSLKLTARTDFPSFIVADYKVRVRFNNKILKEWSLPVLKPGMNHTIQYPKNFAEGQIIEIVNPKGFVIHELK